MASPFRSCSPAAANRPKANGNNGLRKSFNVNVLPKATPSRNSNQPTFTPANSPADYSQRASPFKDLNAPAWQSEEIGLENVRPCPPKSASAKSPAPKGMKNFMSPTFSAASKAASSKKRILVEKNESVGFSQIPAKVPSDFASPHSLDVPASCEPMREDTHMKENEEAPRDCVEVDLVRSVTQPENQTKNDVCRVLYQVPESSTDNDSLSFLSQFPDPGEECTIVLPPYDPKRNYLSPRPDFLRYRPNRGLDIDVIELDEGFGKYEVFKPETPPESGVTETKEIESLGEQMDAVGISSEDLDHRETHEEFQVKLALVGNSEQNPCNPGPEFDSKKNALEEMEETCDDSDEEDEEEQKQGSRWLRTSLMSGFVLLIASVALLRSGSPGLLPPSLHHNALAGGEFYGSSVDIVKRVVVIWRKDSVKKAGYSVLGYSRMKYGIIAKTVNSWFDSSSNKLGIITQSSTEDDLQNSFENSYTGDIEETGRSLHVGIDVDDGIKSVGIITQSSTEDVLQNSFENSCTGDIEETGRSLHVGIDVDDGIKSVIPPSQLLVDSVGGEDLKGKQSSTEAVLEAFDAILVKDVSQIPSVDVSIQQSVQVNTDDDVLPKNTERSLPSDLLDEDNSEGGHGSGDFVDNSLDAHAHLEDTFSFYSDIEDAFSFYSDIEDTFSFYSDIEEEKDELGRIEDSWPEVESEETQNVSEYASEEQSVPVVPETIQISDPAEIFASIIVEDSQVSGEDALNKQSRPSMVPSDKYQNHHASQNEKDDKSFTEDIEFKKSDEPKESSLSAGEDSNGSEVQASAIPRRHPSGLLPIGTRAVLSILVASVIAAIYFVYASKKRSRISREVVEDKPTVGFFAKKEPQKENYPTYSPVHFSSSRNFPHVQLLAEYHLEEMSSSDKNTSRINAQEKSVQMYERRFRRGNIFSSATQQESAATSEISSESPSYGSFTTYEKIVRKEGGGDEDPKVVTPVRRSSRIRKQATSP